MCTCDTHLAYSRTRIGQLNDKIRNHKYVQALRKTRVNEHTVCLCLSDGCLLALAAAKMGATVFLLEQNFLSRKTMQQFVETNGLSERVTFVDSVDSLPKETEIDLIFGEPYFLSSIVPWENLRFWYLASNFSESIRRMPVAATIRALFVEFKDLHKIRAPLGVCEGFDLSSFDELVQVRVSYQYIAVSFLFSFLVSLIVPQREKLFFLQNSSEKSDSPIEAQPLWEYPCKALSEPFDIAQFNLSRNINLDEHIRLMGVIPIEE